MELEVNNQYPLLKDPITATQALAECLDACGEFPLIDGELSIVFVNDPTIAAIHDQFMNDPTPTDVITFPAAEEMQSAGEIIVSVDHAKMRAKELDVPFSQELSLYIAHGWLHLNGYDDREEDDRAAMRLAETRAMTALKNWKSPILFELN